MLMNISIFNLKESMEIISFTYIDRFVIIKKSRLATKLVTCDIYNNMFVYHQPRMRLSVSIRFTPICSTDIICFDTFIQ